MKKVRPFLYEQELKLAKGHAERVKAKREIYTLRHSNDAPKKKLNFSKILAVVAYIDFAIIQFYSMWYMAKFPEYSNLGALLSIAVSILGDIGTSVCYFKKSTIENSVGGIVYDHAMSQTSDDSVG